LKTSFAIMAHPDRAGLVGGLMREMPSAEVVWAEDSVEWNTGRRAWLAHDRSVDWHVVVQDDALLCRRFEETVSRALESCPPCPVTFYTGNVEPTYVTVELAIKRVKAAGKRWFSMNGPLWGVCIAIPTSRINDMVAGADQIDIPYYDLKLARYFGNLGIDCRHSVPSLVDHRIGPSLLNGYQVRDRQAHEWIGFNDSGLRIDWNAGCLPWLDASKWTLARTLNGYRCGSCETVDDRLSEVIGHIHEDHALGRVDFIATSRGSATVMGAVFDKLPAGARGDLYLIGQGGISPLEARRALSKQPDRFTVVDTHHALVHANGRRAWSMDNKVEVDGRSEV
jgi:hypothetical protein